MTNRFSSFVAAAVLLAATGPGAAQPREMSPPASPRATGVTDVTRYGVEFFQERKVKNCGSNYVNCILVFSSLTRNMWFTRVNCTASSSNIPISLSLENSGGTIRAAQPVALPVAPTTYAQQVFSETYVYYTNINEEVDVIMRKGTTPLINFYANGNRAFQILSISCTLTGRIL